MQSALYLKTNNQFGKTTVAAAMVVFHALKSIPPWYGGWKPPKLDLIRPHTLWPGRWLLIHFSVVMGSKLKSAATTPVEPLAKDYFPRKSIRSVQISRGISGGFGYYCLHQGRWYDSGNTLQVL